jgi:hypothetical protein
LSLGILPKTHNNKTKNIKSKKKGLNPRVLSFLCLLIFIPIHHQAHCQSLHLILIFTRKKNPGNRAPLLVLDLGVGIP